MEGEAKIYLVLAIWRFKKAGRFAGWAFFYNVEHKYVTVAAINSFESDGQTQVEDIRSRVSQCGSQI